MNIRCGRGTHSSPQPESQRRMSQEKYMKLIEEIFEKKVKNEDNLRHLKRLWRFYDRILQKIKL